MSLREQDFQRATHPLFIQRFITGVFQENSWFLRDQESGRSALVDPGDAVDQALVEAGLLDDDALKLHEIFLTHAHLDHVWGLSALKKRWPEARIWMHHSDLELLKALPQQGAMVGIPAHLEAPPLPEVFVEDNEQFSFGQRSVEVIHTPGHTEGGVCYLFDTGDCFVGDMIIAGSVGRTDLPGGNPQKMNASLKRLTQLPQETWIYGGHGPESMLGDELRTNAVLPSIIRGDYSFF